VIADKVKELDQTNKDKEKLLKNINGIWKTFGTPSENQTYKSWV
jgi:hypothetical protein